MTQYTRRTPDQWQSLILQWQDSNLSAIQFCQQQNVGYASFCNWRKRLSTQPSPTDNTEEPVQFLDLQPLTSSSDSGGWDIVLSLGNGVELRLSQN